MCNKHIALSFLLSFFLFSLFPILSYGQDVLDTIFVTSSGRRKNYIHWEFKPNLNQPAKSIGIQRAKDSTSYFSTIGHAPNPANVKNNFTDNQSSTPSNIYRLFILFQDGSYVFSKPANVIIVANALTDEPGSQTSTSFQPSIYVYSNPDGNINISIADAQQNNYTLRFYDSKNQFIFEVNKISKPLLIIDKVNFLHAGWFHYELYKNGVINEKWKFYIPAQGEKPSN